MKLNDKQVYKYLSIQTKDSRMRNPKEFSPLFFLLVLGCMYTPLDRAKKSVGHYVKTMLNNPEYYQAVKWGALDLCLPVPADTLIQFKRNINTGEISYSKDGKKWLNSVSEAYDVSGNGSGQIIILVDNKWVYTPFYKEEYVSKYKIDHSFRIRGPKNQKKLLKYTFFLDSTFIVSRAEEQGIKALDE
jgi:hypothetical protein